MFVCAKFMTVLNSVDPGRSVRAKGYLGVEKVKFLFTFWPNLLSLFAYIIEMNIFDLYLCLSRNIIPFSIKVSLYLCKLYLGKCYIYVRSPGLYGYKPVI